MVIYGCRTVQAGIDHRQSLVQLSASLSNMNTFTTILMVKKVFRICPLYLKHMPCTTGNSLSVSSHPLHVSTGRAADRSPPKAISSSGLTNPISNFPLTAQVLQTQPPWGPSTELSPVYWCLSCCSAGLSWAHCYQDPRPQSVSSLHDWQGLFLSRCRTSICPWRIS